MTAAGHIAAQSERGGMSAPGEGDIRALNEGSGYDRCCWKSCWWGRSSRPISFWELFSSRSSSSFLAGLASLARVSNAPCMLDAT